MNTDHRNSTCNCTFWPTMGYLALVCAVAGLVTIYAWLLKTTLWCQPNILSELIY